MEFTDEQVNHTNVTLLSIMGMSINDLNNNDIIDYYRYNINKYHIHGLLLITDIYSYINFNCKELIIFSKITNIIRKKILIFIKNRVDNILVVECKKFLNIHYGMGFKFQCLAYTVKGLSCKNYNCKENLFCHIHYNFDLKIIDVLNTVFIPDITRICIDKIF